MTTFFEKNISKISELTEKIVKGEEIFDSSNTKFKVCKKVFEFKNLLKALIAQDKNLVNGKIVVKVL